MSYLFPLLWEYAEWDQKSLFTEWRILKTEEKIKNNHKENKTKRKKMAFFVFLMTLLEKNKGKIVMFLHRRVYEDSLFWN